MAPPAKLTWFVCIDPSDKGKPVSRLEQVDFRIQVQPTDPNYMILMSGGVINWNGQPLTRWKGPFATEAEAKAAQNPQQQSPNPVTDITTAAQNANFNPLGWLGAIGHWIGEAVAHILDVHMWRSIGWITLGVVLLVLGLLLWLKKENYLPSAVPA